MKIKINIKANFIFLELASILIKLSFFLIKNIIIRDESHKQTRLKATIESIVLKSTEGSALQKISKPLFFKTENENCVSKKLQ